MVKKMDNDIINSITEEYEELRAKAKHERDIRVERVYRAVPEIEDIDKKIAETGENTLKTLLRDPDNKDAKSEMKSRFRILSDRRRELLKQNHIPEDFDKIKYSCPLCGDTGYVEGKGRCSCFRQKVILRTVNDLYRKSNMNELLETENFSTFRMDVYSREHVNGYKRTPYDNMRDVYNFCLDFAENFDRKKKGLVFQGDTGLGKTFMSSCIAKYLMDRQKTVMYLRASRLFRMFDDDRFGRLSGGMDEVYGCDLLIIDDLGTEAEYKNNTAYLMELIDERVINGKKMIINTNLSFEQLEKRYTKRLSSRLLENFEMLFFYGEDIRRINMFRKKTDKKTQ